MALEVLNDWIVKCPFCASDQMRLETTMTASKLAKTQTKHQLLTETDKTLGIYTTMGVEAARDENWVRFDCQRCENSSWMVLKQKDKGQAILQQGKTEGDTGLPGWWPDDILPVTPEEQKKNKR